MDTNEDVKRRSTELASTACFLLASNDDIFPRGPFLLPSSIPHSSLLSSPLPPSVLASLPLWLSSRCSHHNWSVSCNISSLNLRKESSVFLSIYSFSASSLPSLDACTFSSPLYFLLFCFSLFPLLCWLEIFFFPFLFFPFRTRYFCLPPRFLQRSHLC